MGAADEAEAVALGAMVSEGDSEQWWEWWLGSGQWAAGNVCCGVAFPLVCG